MGRKKLTDDKVKKNRSVRISDIDEMLLNKSFKTRQKALNFLISFIGKYPSKVKFYKQQVKGDANAKSINN